MATCSRQVGALVMDEAISAPANSTHELGSFDTFVALVMSVTLLDNQGRCSHLAHIRSSFCELPAAISQHCPRHARQNEIKSIPYVSSVKSFQPHIPLLPAPDIISATRQSSTQRPICTLTFLSGCPPLVPGTVSHGSGEPCWALSEIL